MGIPPNNATPPQGCFQNLPSCINALCGERSNGGSRIDWNSRYDDLVDFSNLDTNMIRQPARNSSYEAANWRWESTSRRPMSWAADSNFRQAHSHRFSTPQEKAEFRHRVARQYLDDHPDDCQPPPPPPPTPAVVRSKRPATVPVQLSLFREKSPVSITRAWWTSPTFKALGYATAFVGGICALFAETGGATASFAGFSLQFFNPDNQKTPVI